MDINLNDIALYVEVVRRKSFTRASKALGIPLSTLSRRITELERTIGTRLLNRTTRRLDLTSGGSFYYQRCRRLVEKLSVAHEGIAELRDKSK